MRKPTFPLNKGCGIVPFLSKGLVESFSMSVRLLIYLFWLICVSFVSKCPTFSICQKALQNVHRHTLQPFTQLWLYFSTSVAMARESPPPPNNLTSSWQLYHSSLAGLSSRGVMAGRPIPVALWDAVRLATVCRRTRTSRQSLSRLLHSLQAAEELREVRCWHGGWVLFRVPLERLSTFKSHHTSQHSASGSTPDG